MCDFWRELARLITFFDDNLRHMWRVQHVALLSDRKAHARPPPRTIAVQT